MSNLKSLPLDERPRERLSRLGAHVLSNVELIAILLGSGMKGKSVLALSQEILSHFGSLTQLQEVSVEDLCEVKGLGKAKAIQLKAALSLAGRVNQEHQAPKHRIASPLQAYLWVKEYLVHRKKEIFGVILQDTRGHIVRWEEVSVGTLTQALVHPREVFRPAIRHLAASIILVHNHPSGDPTPSPQDYHITRRLCDAGHSIGIPVNDHLIVCQKRFFSLKEEGFNFASEGH